MFGCLADEHLRVLDGVQLADKLSY